MPVSNGQVSGRDIRQETLRTLHLRDEAITEAKLASLAVSVEKTEEPVWVSSFSTGSAVNQSLSTTTITMLTETVTIPAWVGLVNVLIVARLQARQTTGGVQGFVLDIGYNGINFPGGVQADVQNGGVGEIVMPRGFALSAPGGTIDLNAFARTVTGTNSENQVYMAYLVVGTR